MKSKVSRLALVLAGVLPYALPYLAHLIRLQAGATGFIQYDQPYYLANGRAIFERGNGLAYPNPYDPSPDAPVIYVQWLIWVLGAGVSALGVDPGVWLDLLGILAALACSYATLRLVEWVIGDGTDPGFAFLLVMWGGGIFAWHGLWTWLSGPERSLPSLGTAMAGAESGLGWWCLFWGRNVVLPLEGVYHALMGWCWLAALRGRWALALGLAVLLGATHPFTGAQVIAILCVGSIVFRLAWGPERVPAWVFPAFWGLLAVFAGYYLAFLNLFPSHRALQEVWSLAWRIDGASWLRSHLLVGVFAAWRLIKDGRNVGRDVPFLAAAFVVSLALSNHDLFMRARQPAHFSRGYSWLALALIGLPAVCETIGRLGTRRKAVAAFVLVVASLDNVVWLATTSLGAEPPGIALKPGEREILATINRLGFRGVLLTEDARLSYLAATYTAVRPYRGHDYNTPDSELRRARVRDWFWKGEIGPWFDEVDLILVEHGRLAARHLRGRWEVAASGHQFEVLGRVRLPSAVETLRRGPTGGSGQLN
ncbi:hypothetical protein EP7_003774 [Isosphaeraceae bacterium EP7]